jgi:hypothetical protein
MSKGASSRIFATAISGSTVVVGERGAAHVVEDLLATERKTAAAVRA